MPLHCPYCRSDRLRRLIPWWEPWLGLVLALTVVGLPSALRLGQRPFRRGDRLQCDACACQLFDGLVRAA